MHVENCWKIPGKAEGLRRDLTGDANEQKVHETSASSRALCGRIRAKRRSMLNK